MLCFNRASRPLIEILDKLQSDGRPNEIDHNLYEYGSVRYNIQASVSDPHVVNLSVWMPQLYQEAHSDRLPEYALQDIRKLCPDAVEILEPPKQGFLLTLRLNFNMLPDSKEDCMKAITNISSIRAVILSSQLKSIFWTIGFKDITHRICKPIKIAYHPNEPFFIINMQEKIAFIYPMRFKYDSDVVLATSFFQELTNASNSAACAKAPSCTWSPIPPSGLRGEAFQHLATNGGFVSLDISPRHVKTSKIEDTIWNLLNFSTHVKYHVKCTRSFIQRKMRQHMERLTEVISNARPGHQDTKKLRTHKQRKRMVNLSKLKAIKRRCGTLTNQIKKLRLRIRIKWFAGLRRRWSSVQGVRSLRKYTKLE